MLSTWGAFDHWRCTVLVCACVRVIVAFVLRAGLTSAPHPSSIRPIPCPCHPSPLPTTCGGLVLLTTWTKSAWWWWWWWWWLIHVLLSVWRLLTHDRTPRTGTTVSTMSMSDNNAFKQVSSLWMTLLNCLRRSSRCRCVPFHLAPLPLCVYCGTGAFGVGARRSPACTICHDEVDPDNVAAV